MANLTEKLTDLMVPPSVRPYWTFRNAAIVAVLSAVATAFVHAFVTFPPEYVARWESQSLFHSPILYLANSALVAAMLWIVHVTRGRTTWYPWRVALFAMALAGALIGLVDVLLPLRSK
jgi:hypothetical protein